MRKLSTTSYAILGLLSVQESWSTYELARQIDRGLRNLWPVADSVIYEEAKNLVAHGLATAQRRYVGRRPRTEYSITDAGREALGRWLEEPGHPPSLAFESMLKVFFAENGTRDDLLGTLRHIRDWAEEREKVGRVVARDNLTGEGPFPGRRHVIVLTFAFLWDFIELVHRWAEWAEDEVEGWPDTRDGETDLAPFQRALQGGPAVPIGSE